jgi:hypothetical protein
MLTDKSSVIVQGGGSVDSPIPTTCVFHRDFPEMRARGRTVTEGALGLAEMLDSASGWACETWRREALCRAQADVKDFLHAVSTGELAFGSPHRN